MKAKKKRIRYYQIFGFLIGVIVIMLNIFEFQVLLIEDFIMSIFSVVIINFALAFSYNSKTSLFRSTMVSYLVISAVYFGYSVFVFIVRLSEYYSQYYFDSSDLGFFLPIGLTLVTKLIATLIFYSLIRRITTINQSQYQRKLFLVLTLTIVTSIYSVFYSFTYNEEVVGNVLSVISQVFKLIPVLLLLDIGKKGLVEDLVQMSDSSNEISKDSSDQVANGQKVNIVQKDATISRDDSIDISDLKATNQLKLKTSQKWLYTLVLWIFGALIMSVAFGDDVGGTLIQAVIQIGLTIYIWTRPHNSDARNVEKEKG
jgi:hypothetical protein